MTIKIFADTSDLSAIRRLVSDPRISGLTTNPTLMRRAGVADYRAFAREVLETVPADWAVSFEVLGDDLDEMEQQAREIASWSSGHEVFVKVPIMNSRGAMADGLIHRLSDDGIRVNVTAVLTREQIAVATDAMCVGVPTIVSVFAGRVADTGRDPSTLMRVVMNALAGRGHYGLSILWASARGVYDVYQAEAAGCDIITLPPDLIAKLDMRGRDLHELSLETVRQFRDDALAAGYTIETGMTAS